MANLSSQKHSNIARPYALAAFEYAQKTNQLATWKKFLETAASIAQDDNVVQLLEDPAFPSKKLFDLFEAILGSQVDSKRKNFLLLLSQNKRLMMLPAIADLFDTYYATLEKNSIVRVVTATPIKKDFEEKLAQALTKRVQQKVTLQCEIDPALIGGAIIHIGDRVIDGSIAGN